MVRTEEVGEEGEGGVTFYEFVQWMLGGFWRFVGCLTLLTVTLHYGVNGLVLMVRALMGKP